MKYVRYAAFLVFMLVTIVGCDSKRDKPVADAKTAASAVSPQDLIDARAMAARVHSQMEAGEFSTIYKESAPEFKQIGNETQFVSTMKEIRRKTGAVKELKEVGNEIGPNKRQILLFKVQYENIPSDQRMTFARSDSGKMELCGLNQKDAVKKK